jgi:hypothetical protein
VIVRELGNESGSWKGKWKNSYHIVVNNGYFFKNNQDLKQFILYIGNIDIDIAVYGSNQNFKLPYQSKFGSKRAQKPLNVTFKDHLIGRYETDNFLGHLEVSYKNETLPKKETNDVIKELDETKYKNTSTDTYDIGPICETEDLNVDVTSVKSLMNVLAWVGNRL